MTKNIAVILGLLQQFKDANIVALTDILTDIVETKFGRIEPKKQLAPTNPSIGMLTIATCKYLIDTHKKITDQEVLEVIDQIIEILEKKAKMKDIIMS